MASRGSETRPARPPGEDPLREDPLRPVVAPEPTAAEETDTIAPARASGARPARNGPARPRRARTLGVALLTTVAATVAPGSGHLMLRRRRTGVLILGAFLLVIAALLAIGLGASRAVLLESLLSTRVLIAVALLCLLAALAWMAVIVRTWVLARPRALGTGQRLLGAGAVTVLCLGVAAPLVFGANLANSQRNLLDALFPDSDSDAVAVIDKPRLNILLIGSDAGPDRTGTRTDTMMVASVDTRTSRTILFGLPRNIGYAQFPPGSKMAEQFPEGFHDPSDPLSGNYLLNAVYAYGLERPDLAPPGPTRDPGLNMLHETVSYMLGLPIDYYLEVNMSGFAAILDALGGLRVDVGSEPVPVGGILPDGTRVEPDRYIPPGLQQLSGEEALDFVRSRTDTTDYVRMGRQRCLIQYVLDQKSPADLLTNFQGVARATTDSVSTNIPQRVLPALVALAGDTGSGGIPLESVSFDPNLPDPSEPDGQFNTGRPNFPYMREVVQKAITAPPPPPPPPAPVEPGPAGPAAEPTGPAGPDAGTAPPQPEEPAEAAPESLAAAC
ncbi:MAG TPA: LCP family protein [Pseudonocardia sp.]|nr:LCP family protein [Pseudonocardia sp.]